MAKMTISGLQAAVSAYVKDAKIAGTWEASTDNVFGLLDKVGQQISIKGNFNNPLASRIMGNDLPLGKTVEEYMVDLTTPVDAIDPAQATGEEALKSYLPDVEAVCYSYTLGKKVIPTTIPMGNLERAAISAANAGNFVADITEKQEASQSLYEFALCKELVRKMADKAVNGGLYEVIGELSTVETQESFIEKVKSDVEASKFATENTSLSKTLIGAVPEGSLVLFLKKGIAPSIATQTMAGAFHKEDLGFDCDVEVIDDFGADDTNIQALLVDTRGIKLHSGYRATRHNENGFADIVNIFKLSEFTGYLSKYCYVKAYVKQEI